MVGLEASEDERIEVALVVEVGLGIVVGFDTSAAFGVWRSTGSDFGLYADAELGTDWVLWLAPVAGLSMLEAGLLFQNPWSALPHSGRRWSKRHSPWYMTPSEDEEREMLRKDLHFSSLRGFSGVATKGLTLVICVVICVGGRGMTK